MPLNVNVFNKEILLDGPDYGNYVLVLSADIPDLSPYATQSQLDTQIARLSNYLPLSGGTVNGNLILSGSGVARNLIFYTLDGVAVSARAVNTFGSEYGLLVNQIQVSDGRVDLDPDPTFLRAEFRVSNSNTQFNIYNKTANRYYLRINPTGGFIAGDGGSNIAGGLNSFVAGGAGNAASSTNAFAHGLNNTSQYNAYAGGENNQATGNNSRCEGGYNISDGSYSHAAGFRARALQDYTYAWTDGNLATVGSNIATTRTGQYMVSASGGIFFPGNVGVGTDNNSNRLTVAGTISAKTIIADTFIATGAAVVDKTSTSYTFSLSDSGKIMTFNNSNPITLTVPSGFPVGFNCLCIQTGAGQVTFVASGPATINSDSGKLKISTQYSAASLVSYATDVFNLAGNLAA